MEMEKQSTGRSGYNAVDFLETQQSQKTPHSSPVRARYGVCFVGSNLKYYSVPVTAATLTISYHIGPHYNGTWLYFNQPKAKNEIKQTKVLR